MEQFLSKSYTSFAVLKSAAIIISISNVIVVLLSGLELFNSNIVHYSNRYLIGEYVIALMFVHMILEISSVRNLMSYSDKFKSKNYILGVISLVISLPLFYNFWDDYRYYGADVSYSAVLVPLPYFICGIYDFLIAGKKAY